MPATTHDAGLAFMKRRLDHPQPVSKLYNGVRDTAAADVGALAKQAPDGDWTEHKGAIEYTYRRGSLTRVRILDESELVGTLRK